jgi:hypothetical protein
MCGGWDLNPRIPKEQGSRRRRNPTHSKPHTITRLSTRDRPAPLARLGNPRIHLVHSMAEYISVCRVADSNLCLFAEYGSLFRRILKSRKQQRYYYFAVFTTFSTRTILYGRNVFQYTGSETLIYI